MKMFRKIFAVRLLLTWVFISSLRVIVMFCCAELYERYKAYAPYFAKEMSSKRISAWKAPAASPGTLSSQTLSASACKKVFIATKGKQLRIWAESFFRAV